MTSPLPFAEWIAEARLEQMLSQAEIAELVGVTERTYERWEREGVIPQSRYVYGLSIHLKLDLKQLRRSWALARSAKLHPPRDPDPEGVAA